MIYCNQPKKGGDILSDLLIGYPRVYRFLLIVSYTLPLPALLVYTVFALLHFDLLTLVAGFFGTLIAGVFIFFPLFCIYYAALTFLHTLLDELFFPAFLKKKRKNDGGNYKIINKYVKHMNMKGQLRFRILRV